MSPVISYQPSQARLAGLCPQDQVDALFVSWLQQSDAPPTDVIAEAVRATVRQFGAGGCASRMAQEFGDHPEAAAERMRWVRSLLRCA
jgi:hypothetical protein